MTRLSCSIILIHLCLLYITVVQVTAAEYGAIASLRFRETYDDNVFFEGIEDFEHIITPSLALAAVKENTSLKDGASHDIIDYQRHNEQEAENQ